MTTFFKFLENCQRLRKTIEGNKLLKMSVLSKYGSKQNVFVFFGA